MFVKSAIPAAAECSDDPGADDDVADDDVNDEGVGGVEDVLLASQLSVLLEPSHAA